MGALFGGISDGGWRLYIESANSVISTVMMSMASASFDGIDGDYKFAPTRDRLALRAIDAYSAASSSRGAPY